MQLRTLYVYAFIHQRRPPLEATEEKESNVKCSTVPIPKNDQSRGGLRKKRKACQSFSCAHHGTVNSVSRIASHIASASAQLSSEHSTAAAA